MKSSFLTALHIMYTETELFIEQTRMKTENSHLGIVVKENNRRKKITCSIIGITEQTYTNIFQLARIILEKKRIILMHCRRSSRCCCCCRSLMYIGYGYGIRRDKHITVWSNWDEKFGMSLSMYAQKKISQTVHGNGKENIENLRVLPHHK